VSEPNLLQQPGRTGVTAGGGAEPDARPASRRDAGDHGPDQEYDEEPSRSFLLTLLRALGAMHT